MNLEIFTKDGKLRKTAPKKFECKECGFLTSRPKTATTILATFYVCNKCCGSVSKRGVYIEWKKRTTGQFDLENKIIEYLKENGETSKKDIFSHFCESENSLSVFRNSFSDLVYNGILNVRKHEDDNKTVEYFYSVNSFIQ